MNNKAHLSIKGLYSIVNIKASMNLGLSKLLKTEFKEFNPVERPLINIKTIINPNWISGFSTGEGCFDVNIAKDLSCKTGYKVQLRFRISQHKPARGEIQN